MSKLNNIKVADFGFVLNIISLIMLIGIGGSVEIMPPDAGVGAWVFVLIQAAGAVAVGMIGSKMLLADNKRIS